MVNELLGPHVQIVDDLLKQLRDIQNGDTASPRVVVLEGASGVGKTRIIQELYQKLRENDPYWPPMQEPVRVETAGADPMAARKLVAPNPENFTWPAGALPSFGWWGINCERLSRGNSLAAVAELRLQLVVHTVPLMLALKASRSSWEKFGDVKKRILEIRDEIVVTYLEEGTIETVGEGLAKIGEELAGASVTLDLAMPGLAALFKVALAGGKLVWQGKKNAQDFRENVDQSQRVKSDTKARSVELAKALVDLTHADFPVVVAVEDMHLMGEDFPDFLRSLIACQGIPIMVVATAWPERNAEDPFSQWLKDAEEADTAVRIAVPNLDEEDLVLLVKSHAPNTTDDVARAVATQLPNPHYVKLWLTVPSIQRQIQLHGDAVVLGDSGLTVPHDIHEILRLRWRSLESHIQQALCLAVAINPIEDPLCSFVPGVLEDLAASSAFLNSEEISEGAVRAVDPAQWCRLSEGVEAFTEALLAEHCRDEIGQQFATEEVEKFKAHLRGITSRHIKNEAGDGISMPLVPRALNLAEWQRRFQTSENTSLEDIIALSTLAFFAQQQYDYTTAIACITVAIDDAEQLTEFDPPQLLKLREWHARFLGESGKPYEAAEILQQILPEKSKAHGPDHTDTLAARGNLASWLGAAGRVDEAIGLFEALLVDLQRVLGADHPHTLTARNNLASWLGAAGRVDEAIGQFEVLLEDQQRVLGADHTDTLAARNNLASWLGEAGRVDEAIAQFEVLLEDQQRVLGADHPHTLTTRNNLASFLARAGRVDEAIGQFEVLLVDRQRVLGVDHPDTLATRNNLASWLGEAGRVDEAIGQFEVLLVDLQRVLGADHPHTLATRNNLASWLGEAGRVDEAIGQFEVLLVDLQRVLGADHPDTLTTRNNLASFLARAGRVDEAIGQFEALLNDCLRVLGPDHPLTKNVREALERLKREDGSDSSPKQP